MFVITFIHSYSIRWLMFSIVILPTYSSTDGDFHSFMPLLQAEHFRTTMIHDHTPGKTKSPSEPAKTIWRCDIMSWIWWEKPTQNRARVQNCARISEQRMDSSLFRNQLAFCIWHSTYCKVYLASSHYIVQEGVHSVELWNRELSINLRTLWPGGANSKAEQMLVLNEL